jgi:hypothetical protein
VPPQVLHTQSLIGEITTRSLRIAATIRKSYNSPAGFATPGSGDRSGVNDII